MNIKDAHIGQKVMTETGRIGTVEAISRDSVYVMFGSSVCPDRMYASDLTPVSDPCAVCQKIASMDKCCEYWKSECETARRSRDSWEATALNYQRNAKYWRSELSKLQKEALAETQHFYCDDERKPLAEVAKCYKQVEPDKLLMSQEARRIVEYIAQCTPSSATADEVFRGLPMDKNEVLDALAEARDAGRISLVNGTYEIVRD